MTAVLDVFAWNCYVGNEARYVTAALGAADRLGVDVIVLTEATPFVREVAAFGARHGWQVFHEQPTRIGRGTITEHGDTALLVRNGHKVTREHVVAMREPWVGPKHALAHEPRRYRRAHVHARGQVWKVTASHWPTGYGTRNNADAVAETMRRSKRALRLTMPGRPAIDVGDLNVTTRRLAAWAQPLTVTGTGRADNAIMRGCSGTSTELDHFGSDHPAVHYRFTKEHR